MSIEIKPSQNIADYLNKLALYESNKGFEKSSYIYHAISECFRHGRPVSKTILLKISDLINYENKNKNKNKNKKRNITKRI